MSNVNFELYRRTTLGECLTDALDELIRGSQITPQLAIRVLMQFDKSMAEALSTQVRAKLNLRGHLRTYRYLDEVWTFMLKDPTIRVTDIGPTHTYETDYLKIIACKKQGTETS